ncbi:MAG: hypothetical protein ACFNUP_02045 [Leptotrichia hofstadii]
MFDEFNNLILKPVRFPLEEKVAKSKEEILKELAKKMDSENGQIGSYTLVKEKEDE